MLHSRPAPLVRDMLTSGFQFLHLRSHVNQHCLQLKQHAQAPPTSVVLRFPALGSHGFSELCAHLPRVTFSTHCSRNWAQ